MVARQYAISLHHVGGFSGAMPLNIPPRLRKDFDLYLYDAGADEPLVVTENSSFRREIFFGHAVMDQESTTKFSLTFCRSSSSPYPYSDYFVQNWMRGSSETDMCDISNHDQRAVETIEVTSTTIDGLCQRESAHVDFLTLDAEGSEGAILRGASTQLQSAIVGLVSEIALVPIRDGQINFDELISLAISSGYHLCNLAVLGGMTQNRAPLGWRSGTGSPTAADATFLKDIDRIRREHADPALSLVKLALFCLLVGKMEAAVEALDAALAEDPAVLDDGMDFAYIEMLTLLNHARSSELDVFPAQWTDFFPTYEASSRFGDPDRGVDRPAAAQRYMVGIEDHAQFYQRLNDLISPNPTMVEAILNDYGLNALAESARTRRLVAVTQMVHWLGLGSS